MPDNCPACGVAFIFHAKKHGPRSPSIDRLTNMLGYIPGNVAIICNHCNSVKRDASVIDLRQIADWLERVTDPLYVPGKPAPHALGTGFQEGLWLTF